MKDDALIEAIKELARAVDALNVTLEHGFTCNDCFKGPGIAVHDLFACTCGTCMENDNDFYAKCAFVNCLNYAEWTIGTWQCCDNCAEIHVEKPVMPGIDGEIELLISPWGTANRVGQDAILAHNLEYNLNHFLIPKK